MDYIKSGWLKRHDTFTKLWKRVYCTLQSNIFSAYLDEQMKTIDKQILLSPETEIILLPFSNNRLFSIIISSKESLNFACDSSIDSTSWITSLKNQCIEANQSTNCSLSIDDFIIISVIGRGYYGKVMLVQKRDSGELYALKTIQKSRLIENGKVETVLNERNILAKIKHPFITEMKFAFQSCSKFYLGLEYISGGELFYHIEKCGPLSLYDSKIYIAEISLALEHLHNNGIIYRDLKPENILLDETGHIKLTDFGLSKEVSENTNSLNGTTEYMSPEMLTQQEYGIEIDLWALGILLYEMLTEKTPFYSQNRNKMITDIINSPPDLISIHDKKAANLIKNLLIKDPKKRFTIQDVKSHVFFADMDWEMVMNKKYQPTFIPYSKNPMNTTNFDPKFTTESPIDSLTHSMCDNFPGFSFIDDGFNHQNNLEIFGNDNMIAEY